MAAANAQPAPGPTADQIESWLTPGREANKRGDNARAVTLTSAALAQASKQLPPSHWGLAYLLNDLARWKSATGDRRGALVDADRAYTVARAAFAGLPDQPERVAYFALDAGLLRFQNNDCAGAEKTLSATFASLPQSTMRTKTGIAYTQLLWSRGDLKHALATARSIDLSTSKTTATDAEYAEQLPPLIARIEIDAGSVDAARRRLDAYRTIHRLSADETKWPEAYRDAELAYALAVGDLKAALARARRAADSSARSPASSATSSAANSASNPLDDSIRRAAAQHRLGQVLSLMGRFAEAERAFSNALQLLQDHSNETPPEAANVYHDLAWMYRLLSDYPRSEFFFERALGSATLCSSASDSMPVLMLRERALLRIEQGKIAKALADVDEGLKRLKSVAGDTRVLQALLTAARAFALHKNGDLQGSEQAMDSALDLIRNAEGADSLDLPLGYVHLADLDYRRRQYASAQRNASAALSILDQRGTQSIWGSGAALSLRASASAAEQKVSAYWSDANRFIKVMEQNLAPVGSAGTASQSEFAQGRLQAERLIDVLPARQDATQLSTLVRLMQLPHMSDATASVQAAALESQNLPQNVRELVRQRAELLQKSQALHSSLLIAQQYGQKLEERSVAELGNVTERLARTSDALLAASPGTAGQLLQRAVDIRDVQKLLSPKECLLLQVVTDQAVHALLIDATSVIYRTASVPRKAIQENVDRLRLALDPSTPPANRVAFDARRANELYRSSVGLFAQELAGRNKLIIIADDSFQSIPWSVLVDRVSSTGTPLSYLADRISIVNVPSLQSLVALRSSPAVIIAPRPYAAFAAPDMDSYRKAERAPAGTAAAAALEMLATYQPLPHTDIEVRTIAAALHADSDALYLGPNATEKKLRAANLARYRILSFATHGIMAGELPGLAEPALILTRISKEPAEDGVLTASEIAGLSLRAQLVILSACNTGHINTKAGVTGISGLASAFFAAGTQALFVSHWSVASAATAKLVSRTLELLAADPKLDKAEALRQAMLWMKAGKAGDAYTSPAYWGAFSLVGDSR